MRRLPSFNEAGAVMPRKVARLGMSGGQPRASFNEAGAVMPRKARAPPPPVRPASQASMRPGLLCPGKDEAAGVE